MLKVILCATLLVVSCGDGDSAKRFVIPTSPTTVAGPSPSPPVPPRPPVSSDFEPIEVGNVVHRVIGNAPPECLREPGWPCQYFRLKVPDSGVLTVELKYQPDTQPPGRFGPQGVDLSILDLGGRRGEVWAEYFDATTTRVTASVATGDEWEITLWYTFPRLDYELRASLQPM